MVNNYSFSTENFLISVAGHLFLVAIMITSLYIVVEKAKLVVPDRVEILEIDLSQVQVTRDTTELYNSSTPDLPQVKFPDAQDIVPDSAPDESKPITPPQQKDDAKKTPEQPIKKSTIVRVKRDTTNLNRTMTVSAIDALRVAMTRCWVIDQNRSDIQDLRVTVHLTMYENGMVKDTWFESGTRADTDSSFAYVVETIRTAIASCQPFSMLPRAEFDMWKDIQLTFYPSSASVR